MRTLLWLFVLLLNVILAGSAILFALEPEPSIGMRAFAGITGAIFFTIIALLLLARFEKLPHWGSNVMRLACASIPIAFVFGSLDVGIISGLEMISIVVTCLFAWGTWRAFSLYSKG